MKTCICCKVEKPESEFYKNAASKSGLTSRCKICYYPKDKLKNERKENPLKYMLYNAKHRAKKDGVPFTLTVNNIEMPEYCPILGVKLIYGGTGKTRGYGAADEAASIDRIDPDKGYTPENSVIVSWKANRAKAYLTLKELQNMAEFYKKFMKDE